MRPLLPRVPGLTTALFRSHLATPFSDWRQGSKQRRWAARGQGRNHSRWAFADGAAAACQLGPNSGLQTCRIVCPSEWSTSQLAAVFTKSLHPGDCYCLIGGLGTGKSVFSRAFIQAASKDDSLPVPSPTYLLQNIYDEHEGPPIHHFDLYRLVDETGVGRLSLEVSFESAVSLVEWADRISSALLPADRMTVEFSLLDPALKQALTSVEEKAGPQPVLDDEGTHSSFAGNRNWESQDGEWDDTAWRIMKFVPRGPRHQEILDCIQRSIRLVPGLGIHVLCDEPMLTWDP